MSIFNMDLVLELVAAGLIEISAFPRLLNTIGVLKNFDNWQRDKKLKILLAGYNGARNTGADVRVEAMVKQFYHIFGQDNIEIGIMSLDPNHSSIYFKEPTKIIKLNSVFLNDILQAASEYHLAILSEGSCFKSKFANALTTFFIEASGIMEKQGKHCVAYGSEAGKMDEFLKWMVSRYAKNAYIISRTQPSHNIAQKLGLKGEVGTDTAWTFKGHPASWAENKLKELGWDGKKPLFGFAVINPFWWPVRPDLIKFLKMKFNGKKTLDNYDKWYFFSTSDERTRLFNNYIEAIANSINYSVEKYNAFPVIIGMERLDIGANKTLQALLKYKAPIFCSTDYNGYEMTSILCRLSLLITSRYHARVLSMSAGVPSGAVSMDERLENLLSESGHLNDYYLSTSDENLKDKLPPMLDKLVSNKDKVKQEILKTLPNYLLKMGQMGMNLSKYICQNYPGFEPKIKSQNPMDYISNN